MGGNKKKKENGEKSGGTGGGFKNTPMFRLLNQIKKEFRLIKTDPLNMFIAIFMPPMIIVLFAVMSNRALPTSPFGCTVVSYDSNAYLNPNTLIKTNLDNYTLPYVDAVNSTPNLRLEKFLNASENPYAMEEARKLLANRTIDIIIVIPTEFSEMLINGYPAIVEIVPDISDVKSAQDKLGAVQESIRIFTEENNLTPQVVLQKYEEFSIPSGYNFRYNYAMTLMLSFVIFGISTVLTILVVVQEKPIARLLLTPVSRNEILLSKYITYLVILLVQVLLIMWVTVANGLYVMGSMGDLFIALYTVGVSGVTMGIFISTLANTKTEANQMFFAIFIIVVLLSGIFIPISTMPEVLQWFAYILPLSHGDPMIRSIVTKGNSVIGFHFWSLVIFSIVLFVLSFIIINKKSYEV